MKFPEDERIVKRLEKHFDNVGTEEKESDSFISLFTDFSSQLKVENVRVYLVINEALASLKSRSKDKMSDKIKQANIKKLENYLEVS